jgi:hypothetical protein
MQSRFDGSLANARVFVLNKSGVVNARDNAVNLASTGGFVETQQGSSSRIIDLQNNVVNGTGNVVIIGNVAFYRTVGNSVVGAARVHHFGTILDGQINADKYSGTTGDCILGNAGSSDGTSGSIAIVNVAFGTCGGAIADVNGPFYLSFIDTTGSSGTSSIYALHAHEGAVIRLSTLTSITGTLGDLLLDTTHTSMAAMRATIPKSFSDSSTGSRIFER